jgi:carboxymethylenebutenolidase
MTTNIQTRRITLPISDGGIMPAYVAFPTSPKRRAGLLLFQEAFGVNAHIRDLTERFAKVGYAVIAPALFHRTDPGFQGSYTDFGSVAQHMQALTREGLTADIRAAHQWLTSSEGGSAAEVGSVGYCLGGRVSFLANAVLPLMASVSYYGGGIAPSERSAGLLDRAPDLHAPMLLFWGGQDKHLPPEQTRAVEDALRAAGKDYTSVTFSQADHGFFCDARASYNPVAAAQSWALTLAFFAEHLRV